MRGTSDPDLPLEVVLERLRSEGFRITTWLTACPVQFVGLLPTGEGFCFGARGQCCYLIIVKNPRFEGPELYIDHQPDWYQEIWEWDGYEFEPLEAGCLPSQDAEDIFRHLLGLYQSGAYSHPWP